MQVRLNMARLLKGVLYALVLGFFLAAIARGDALPQSQEEGQRVLDEGTRLFDQAVGEDGFRVAEKKFHQALRIFETQGYRRGVELATNSLGLTHHRLGDYPKAISFYRKSLTAAKRSGHSLGEAAVLLNLSGSYKMIGDHDNAIECCKRCLPTAAEKHDAWLETTALICIGDAYDHQGKYHMALEYYSSPA